MPLPSISLTDARSLTNKKDERNLQVAMNNIVKDSCILLITPASRPLCIVMMGQETQVRAEVEGHVFMLTTAGELTLSL